MDLHGIDLNLLVAFDALAAERSVTKAGKRIGRTQPAMSAALSRLRILLKDQLFVRSTGGLQPTPRALELAEPIAQALADLGKTLGVAREFEPASSQLTFTVAMQEHAAFKLLPGMLRCLREKAPRTKLDIVTFHARDEAITLLDAGACEVAVGVPPSSAPGRIFNVTIFEESFVCIARKRHPGITGPLDLEMFLRLEHLLVSPEGDRFGHTDAVLAKDGLKRKIAVATAQMYPVPALVASSDLIATLMLGVVEASGWSDRLEILRPPIALAPCAYVMSWHRRNDAHPAQQWLRGCIEDVALPHTTSARPLRGADFGFAHAPRGLAIRDPGLIGRSSYHSTCDDPH